jgi:hypothetical protein
MNEQIQELIKQATVEVRSHGAFGETERYTKLDPEKFAQLIVQECIDKITTYDLVPGHSAKWEDIYDIHARLLQDLGEELKEHFGVTK